MGYKFEKFKDFFRSAESLEEKERKNKLFREKLILENRSNEFLNAEMYDLYAQMISNGYKPTKVQIARINDAIARDLKKFEIGFSNSISQLIKSDYKFNNEDYASFLVNEKFMKKCSVFFENYLNNKLTEKDKEINVAYCGLLEKIATQFPSKDFSKKSFEVWLNYSEIKMKNLECSDLSHNYLSLTIFLYDSFQKSWEEHFSTDLQQNFITRLNKIKNYRTDNSIEVLIKKLTEDYKYNNSYEINKLMNQTKNIYSVENIEQKAKELAVENNNFKINQLPIEIQNIIIKIENNCEKLSNNKDVEIQFIISNTMDKVLPETLKKYFTIDEEYRESLKNHQGKNAKDFLVESLTNMNDKLSELLTLENVDKLKEMQVNATYTKNLKNA